MEIFATKIKKIRNIRKLVTFFYPFFFPIIQFLAIFSSKTTAFFYFILMKMDWGKIPRTEWMDHDQDTFYQFNESGSFFHFERGIIPRIYLSNFLISNEEFSNLKLEKKINILDLCSGDSYISQKFFYDLSDTIVSLDLDPAAIARGKKRIKHNKYMNTKHYFYKCDVEKIKISELLRNNKLDIKFDVILFNAAIEHFKEEQLDFIFKSFKEVMKEKSFVSTYTIVEDIDDQKYLPDHHEMFFSSKKHLENVVSKYFKFTKSHHSLVNDRCNIYCIASDQEIKI
jgi:2-polyprenyl-3-methyl-5-hydroxy-6-metoxy-1,4-benzoquinol methylase